jgi:hypothetical protein
MTKGALGLAVVIFVAWPPVSGLAQPIGATPGMPLHVAGASAMAGSLTPSEIAAEVRRAGFDPVNRPVRRGSVYVLFALDPDGMDVELAVDAGSGRVLWINDIVGVRYTGSAGYYDFHALSHYERPPVPPADIPNAGPARNNLGSFRSKASLRRAPPLPRIRPAADFTSGVTKDSAPRVQSEPKVAAPGRSDVVPAATSPAAPPTMVPVAPLE